MLHNVDNSFQVALTPYHTIHAPKLERPVLSFSGHNPVLQDLCGNVTFGNCQRAYHIHFILTNDERAKLIESARHQGIYPFPPTFNSTMNSLKNWPRLGLGTTSERHGRNFRIVRNDFSKAGEVTADKIRVTPEYLKFPGLPETAFFAHVNEVYETGLEHAGTGFPPLLKEASHAATVVSFKIDDQGGKKMAYLHRKLVKDPSEASDPRSNVHRNRRLVISAHGTESTESFAQMLHNKTYAFMSLSGHTLVRVVEEGLGITHSTEEEAMVKLTPTIENMQRYGVTPPACAVKLIEGSPVAAIMVSDDKFDTTNKTPRQIFEAAVGKDVPLGHLRDIDFGKLGGFSLDIAEFPKVPHQGTRKMVDMPLYAYKPQRGLSAAVISATNDVKTDVLTVRTNESSFNEVQGKLRSHGILNQYSTIVSETCRSDKADVNHMNIWMKTNNFDQRKEPVFVKALGDANNRRYVRIDNDKEEGRQIKEAFLRDLRPK